MGLTLGSEREWPLDIIMTAGQKRLTVFIRLRSQQNYSDCSVEEPSGWSIVLTGLIKLVRDPGELSQLDALRLPAWGATEFDRYLSLRPDVVSGRRIADVSRPAALAR